MLEASKRELTEIEVKSFATNLADLYDYPKLLLKFEWNHEKMPTAWETRQALSPRAFIKDSRGAIEYAQSVHRWGFNNTSIRKSVLHKNTFESCLLNAIREWQKPDDVIEREVARTALRTLLCIRGLGLATATKWICFLDQRRFAIYDSRVSYALHPLELDGDGRTFPFIGSRVSNGRRAEIVYGDSCMGNPDRAAITYLNFLAVIRKTAEILTSRGDRRDWCAGLVECCLFVEGKARLRKQ